MGRKARTMDPDEALSDLRGALDDLDRDGTDIKYAFEASETFRSLDRWLSKGGHLPDAWRYGNDREGRPE
jgi:uncharacterized lipoprotein NlpE involved in copper resistance